MNIKRFILFVIMVFVVSLFLTSCKVKTIGKPFTTIPSPTGTYTVTPTVTATIIPTVTPTATPPPSPTPKKCKKPEDCYDANDCTEDICNKKKKCENPNKANGTRCDPSPSPTPSASASGTPGSSPSATPEEYYFCEDGVCKKKKECKDELGGDYITCPTGVEKGKEGYAACCKSNEICCHLDKEADPMCCNTDFTKGDTAVCDTLGKIGDILEKHVNVCDHRECTPPKVPCTAGGGLFPQYTICCEPEPIETCSSQTVKKIIGLTEVPTCVPTGGCKSDEYVCKEISGGGQVCCKGTKDNPIENCISENNVYWCSAIEGKCSEGETFCPGEKKAKGKRNICCPKGTTCFHNPNGYPRCVGSTSVADTSTTIDEIIIV